MSLLKSLLAAGADLAAVENPDWSNDRWTWREFVSEEMRSIWPQLSPEAKLCVYLTAHEALTRFPT